MVFRGLFEVFLYLLTYVFLGHHQQNGSNNTKMQPTREVVINYSGYPELDSDIGPSELR